MTVGLHGLGLGFLILFIITFFIIGFVITLIMVFAERSKKQVAFKELKAYTYFVANIYTGLFDFPLLYIMSKIKSVVTFLDKSHLFPVIVLAS